ncbi:transcriptional regulator [Acidobacteria bacterium Mor1]|nr:transcriptional regulator [Acidobacteria bacterium Mor1]
MLNADATDAFAGKMLGALNGAALAMMTSIGHRTGLFDAMAASDTPVTSQELAFKSGLQERYVREWLGAMTTGEIVDYDAETSRYDLPEAHAAVLTREAGAGNMGIAAQFISVLGGVEDKIVNCFHQGGGVPYEEFGRFHEVMAEESNGTVVGGLRPHILPLCDGLEARLEKGISVLDVGCGRGRAMLALADAYPASHFTGYDLCAETVAYAQEQARARGLANVRFEQMDVTRFDAVESFDLITAFDSIHDQAAPATVLSNISRALKKDGVFLMQDISASSEVQNNIGHPLAPFLYTISTMHCMTVSLAQDGAGLGTCWGRELAEKMLREAGFTSVTINSLEHDIMNEFYVATK